MWPYEECVRFHFRSSIMFRLSLKESACIWSLKLFSGVFMREKYDCQMPITHWGELIDFLPLPNLENESLHNLWSTPRHDYKWSSFSSFYNTFCLYDRKILIGFCIAFGKIKINCLFCSFQTRNSALVAGLSHWIALVW